MHLNDLSCTLKKQGPGACNLYTKLGNRRVYKKLELREAVGGCTWTRCHSITWVPVSLTLFTFPSQSLQGIYREVQVLPQGESCQ